MATSFVGSNRWQHLLLDPIDDEEHVHIPSEPCLDPKSFEHGSAERLKRQQKGARRDGYGAKTLLSATTD
jgi:hypothetical protein